MAGEVVEVALDGADIHLEIAHRQPVTQFLTGDDFGIARHQQGFDQTQCGLVGISVGHGGSADERRQTTLIVAWMTDSAGV